MKKLILCVISVVMLLSLVAFSRFAGKPSFSPEEKQIRNICELATLKCYYHNVADTSKTPGKVFTHWFEKDRKLWIEYTGYAKIGVDMSQVSMTVNDTDVTIEIPQAKVISVDVEESSLTKESYFLSDDGVLNKNEFTPEEQTEAIRDAQATMLEAAQSNTSLLVNAQDRAKELIETYIRQLAEAAGTEYQITWVEKSAAPQQ